MKPAFFARAGSLGLLFLSGCAGVPKLYRSAPGDLATTTLAPKVGNIVDHIACELKSASVAYLNDPAADYLITILLTLQVDDNLHLTPSLSFINPLKVDGTSSTVLEAADIGGARRRTFTTTYYLSSNALKKTSLAQLEPDKNGVCGQKELYRLDGDLGLREVVRDGVKSYDVRYGLPRIVVAPPSPPPPKPDDEVEASTLSFGSTIQFEVNRSITALGPIWTLERFKGPGGSNGLLNGKRLDTDSIIITFVRKPLKKDATDQEKLIAQLKELTEAIRRQIIAEEATKAAKSALKSGGFKSMAAAQAVAETTAAEGEAREATARAQADVISIQRRIAGAQTDTSAIQASQNLLNSMLLQNLNVQPR